MPLSPKWIGKPPTPPVARIFRLPNLPIIARQPQELNMSKTTPEQNKTIVLKAFDTLFNKRDYAAAERFWSPNFNTVPISSRDETGSSISSKPLRRRLSMSQG